MLIQSIVRFTLGINDHRVVSAKLEKGSLKVKLAAKRGRRLSCGLCKKKAWPRDTTNERVWQHVGFWGIQVLLIYTPHRVKCADCGIRVEHMPWSLGKSPLSYPLVTVLAFWARILAWDQVAGLFNVSWYTVKRAVDAAVDYGRSEETYEGVRYIGIDEISRKKGHVYHTMVYDLDRKRLIWSGADRSKDSLRRFFEWWGEERTAAICGICCDMWQSYIDVIQEYCGEAVIVFDKFHIIRHLLDAVDKVRRMEARALAE
ncbi:MAG TPA: transposase [Chromatiaceae bacterium]|nr:transposase [Chromatiaceae bacterium]